MLSVKLNSMQQNGKRPPRTDEQLRKREKKTLEEKNRLAAENAKKREEKEKEQRLRSEKALDNLVASRKRRR